MVALPTGIVTFFFSDVEGSTRKASELGDERWAAILQEHRKILRAAFEKHDGREVDTQGDSFFVAFARATDAAACALAAQRALTEHPGAEVVRVRIGLHTGEALLREGNYIGQEVHRGSRICDAGHGGQIVLSQTTAELLRAGLREGSVLTELGRHRLKDLGAAQALFQLSGPGLVDEFPPLRTLESFANNLPAQRSSFIGREKEVGAVRSLLEHHRLVTLSGLGGAGKTRLALQVSAEELGRFPDGVFFVDLAPIGNPDLVAQTVAAAAGMSLGGVGARPIEDLLAGYLANSRCLLLLDNCEHLIDRVADLVDRILVGCPEVVLCATSREPLGVEGEHVWRVPSLSLPGEGLAAERSEAVRLFLDRAEAVQPGFAPAAADLGAIVEICRRLDGIPLAIEFAAARTSHLSPRQIAERLADALRLLGGARRRVQRQQTLEAALDWSHDLLSTAERGVFRRLGVFAGSFDLAAVEGIAPDAETPVPAILDLVGSLVAKSLVTIVEDPEGVRYRLLETVRAYALRKLRDAGEADSFRSRHRDHYVRWVEAMPLERTWWSSPTLFVLDREIDNLRAAADECLDGDRPDLLARLVSRMVGLWWWGDRAAEGHSWLLTAIENLDRLSEEETIACFAALSFTSMARLDGRQVEFATRAIEVAGARADPFVVLALVHRALGLATAFTVSANPQVASDALGDARRAVAMASSGMAPPWLAFARQFEGWVKWVLGDQENAAVSFAAGLEAIEDSGDFAILQVWGLGQLATCLHLLGRTEEAREAALSCRRISARGAYDRVLGRLQAESVAVLAAGGLAGRAIEEMGDALRNALRVKLPLLPNLLLCAAGAMAHDSGQPVRAAKLFAAARYAGGAADSPIPFRSPSSFALYRHYIRLVRDALGPEAAHRARDEGRAMTLDEAITYALEGLETSSDVRQRP